MLQPAQAVCLQCSVKTTPVTTLACKRTAALSCKNRETCNPPEPLRCYLCRHTSTALKTLYKHCYHKITQGIAYPVVLNTADNQQCGFAEIALLAGGRVMCRIPVRQLSSRSEAWLPKLGMSCCCAFCTRVVHAWSSCSARSWSFKISPHLMFATITCCKVGHNLFVMLMIRLVTHTTSQCRFIARRAGAAFSVQKAVRTTSGVCKRVAYYTLWILGPNTEDVHLQQADDNLNCA